jgi:hypothetical protein
MFPGMELNVGLQGLITLEPFIEGVSLAETNHSIMKTLLFKMEHSETICKEFLNDGINEYVFA